MIKLIITTLIAITLLTSFGSNFIKSAITHLKNEDYLSFGTSIMLSINCCFATFLLMALFAYKVLIM